MELPLPSLFTIIVLAGQVLRFPYSSSLFIIALAVQLSQLKAWIKK